MVVFPKIALHNMYFHTELEKIARRQNRTPQVDQQESVAIGGPPTEQFLAIVVHSRVKEDRLVIYNTDSNCRTTKQGAYSLLLM